MKFKILGNYYEKQFHYPLDDHQSGKIEKFSPANTKEKLWECPVSRNDIDNIISSSTKGFKVWKNTSLSERINFLNKYKENIQKRSEEIATAISLETGKPFWEAKTEVQSVINKVNISIEISLKRIEKEVYKEISPNTDGYVNYKPIGVCLVIGPFNFPCHLANGQIVNALLAGNSIIFKPSEKTIYSAQLLIEAFHEAEFPPGVINFINGSGKIASKLLQEKSIKGVFFTGSVEVGKKILQQTNNDLSKLVALELGGNNSCILHDDANIELALEELVKASFLTTGQRCVSTSKIFIHESLKDTFINRFHQLAKKIIIDHPIDHEKEPFMGPLIDELSMKNYLNFMGMAIREGGQEVMRGKELSRKYPGYYVTPSIHFFEKYNKDSHFLSTEIFGPNVAFIPYTDIDEAINMANSTEYGLSSGIFTKDDKLFEHFVKNIDAGIINRNRSTCGASGKLPFGGVKNSGNYRPAGSFMIDHCVHPAASLDYKLSDSIELGKIKGIDH